MAAWTDQDRAVLGERLRALIAAGGPLEPITAGHPYPGQRYRHGWIKIEVVPTSTAAGRKKVHAALATSDDEVLRNLDTRYWASKLYRPHVMLAKDHTGKVVGFAHFNAANKHKPSDWRSDGVDLHDMRVATSARGKGVGAHMIDELRRQAPHKPMKVYNALDSAKPFYEKTGADFGHAQSHMGVWPAHNATTAAVTAIVAGHPYPGQRYKHNWIPVAGGEVHAHLGRPDLTRGQAEALDRHQNVLYHQMNAWHRTGDPHAADEAMGSHTVSEAELKRVSADLDAAFQQAKPTTKPITVYRGVGGALPANPRPGEVLTDKGYMSTSSDPGAISVFTWDKAGENQERPWRITVPPGSKAISVGNTKPAGNADEAEVMLPRGTRLRVTGAGKRYIDAEVVP